MKKYLIFILFAIHSIGYGQEYLVRVWDSSVWTDGVKEMRAMSDGQHHVYFDWRTRYDDGQAFSLNVENFGKDEYSIQQYSDDNDALILNASVGDKAVIKTIGIERCIVVTDKEGNVCEVLKRSKDYSKEADDAFMTQFVGTYSDVKGRTAKLTTSTITLPGICSNATYSICTRDFMPIEYIYVAAVKKYFCLNADAKGLKIHAATASRPEGMDYEEFTTYDTGKLLFTLTPSTYVRRWPFASTKLLTRGMLLDMPKESLRLMRNEIFASHGYTFSSAEMKSYFAKQKWYKPLNKNSTMKLSEIETINVNLLKNMEE